MTQTDNAPAAATFRDLFAVAEFRALITGFAAFMIGETGKTLALSVLIYAQTGSALLSAVAYASSLLPYAVGGVLLLSLADRLPPRALIIGYELVRLGMLVLLAIAPLSPLAMLGLVMVVGLFAPVSAAARTALLPELLSGDAYVLGRSAFTVVSGGGQVLGLAVGGLLLTQVGPYGLLWIAAASCALSAALVARGLGTRPPRDSSRGGTVRVTWQVNRSLLADRRIRGLLLAQWLPGSLMVGAESVLVPYADLLGAAGVAGLLLGAAAGMLVGDLLVARLVRPDRRERLTPWLALLLGVPLLFFLARPAPILAALLLAASTFGFAYHLGLARRFVEAVPEHRRGQAFGLATTGMMTAQGLAMTASGALAEWISPPVVIALFGVASLAATLACWRVLADPGRETLATRG